MNYFIITGTSRGIGEAVAKSLIKQDNCIICVSRSGNESLKKLALDNKVSLYYFQYNLAETSGIETLTEEIFSKIDLNSAKSIYLLNNAGVLQPIRPLGKCTGEEISQSISVNTVAPVILSARFIEKTQNLNIRKRIINISSGAGLHAYYGWTCYCTTKAALNMLTECIHKEQKECTYPVEAISLAPGIIETDMQVQIRNSSAEDFRDVDFFVNLKESGKTISPQQIAVKIENLILSDNLENGKFYDFIER